MGSLLENKPQGTKRKLLTLVLLTVLLQLFGGVLLAQTIRIKGTVADAEKNAGIPNINIFLHDTRVGTVSNQTGAFSINLPSTYGNRYLYFSGIGYRKDSLLIRNIQSPVTIRLQPETYRLTEIYVMPDSTLLTLLRRAYNRIPDNYPTTPTAYEGFYRESNQNTNREQADFVELVLSVYKDPYDKPSHEPGQVEVLKSRKRNIRDTGILYYGGPHTPIRSDVVLKRSKYIVPRYFKDYDYEFNGIKALGNQQFYDIGFRKTAKDTSYVTGTMLIEKESLAYVQFEIEGEIDKHHPQVKKRVFTDKVVYDKHEDKWHFKYYKYAREDYRYAGDTLYGKVDYVTTSIKTENVKPIPYERRLALLDVPAIKAEEYTPDGWTDYDILKNVETGQTNFQFSQDEATDIFMQNKPMSSTKAVLPKLIPYLLKLYYDIGLTYKPVSVSSLNHQFSFRPNTEVSPFAINKHQKKGSEYILLTSTVGYHVTKNIDVIYQVSIDLFNKSVSSNEYYIGLGYKKNLKPTGRPLFAHASVLFGFRNYYAGLGKYDNPSTFRYDGTKIDAKKISFDYGVQQKALTPQIGLSKSIGNHLQLKWFLSYNIEINNKHVFRIKEEKGGWFSKKKVTIPANDPGLTFPDHTVNIWDSFSIHKWQTGVTLVFN